jgi:hypothetical protein
MFTITTDIRERQGSGPAPVPAFRIFAKFIGRSDCRVVDMISGIHAEVFETADWIEQALPRKPGHGKNAGG